MAPRRIPGHGRDRVESGRCESGLEEGRGGARQPGSGEILDADNTASDLWADSAYRSVEIEAKLEAKGLKSRIHRKGHRNKLLSAREKRDNKTRSKVRARVEHVFGAQSNDMGGTLVRSIGLVRARARIGLKNLAYNMRRLVQLERLATAPT